MKNRELIREFLEEKYHYYNQRSFIERDPISIPHCFSKKEDIEISGFLTATISWGHRVSILKNAKHLMELMDYSPHQFVTNHTKKELKPFERFVHRTFNGEDCKFFLSTLQRIYRTYDDLETAFEANSNSENFGIKQNIVQFRERFLHAGHLKRIEKHISDPGNNSSAKRLCMFLRWMVRKDRKGVDFGIWDSISPAQLCLPLDVHTGNVGRALGLLHRKQNDWKAVEEITTVLRYYDKNDPIKYDFALFGLGEEKALRLS